MTDVTHRFFTELGRRGHEPLLERANGVIRFDLDHVGGDGDAGAEDASRGDEALDGSVQHWVVDIRAGDMTVSQQMTDADCVVSAGKATFDRVVAGDLNAMACALRGSLRFTGSPELLVLFRRLLPGPSNARGGQG